MKSTKKEDKEAINNATADIEARANSIAEGEKDVKEMKRFLAYKLVKISKEYHRLINIWSTLFPDDTNPLKYYQEEIGKYDILNEMGI